MPPQNPRPTGPRSAHRGAAALPACLLLIALCAASAVALAVGASGAPRPGQEQNPAPTPTPTPYVRPRTVAPKEAPAARTQPTAQPTTQPTTQPTPAAQPQPTTAATPAPPPATAAPPADAQPRPAGAAPAQSAEEVDEDEVVRVDSNLVIIPASVVDARGRAITDLKVEDFELKIDGEVKPIGDLSRSETPVHVALLFDNSYSLSAAREFEKQAAVRFFRTVVRPIDRAAVYSISTTPRLAQGLTNDVPRLVRTIEGFSEPEGATALFDAVAQSADYMRPLPGRKVLVIVSDGTDTVSDLNFDEAVNRALRAECQVYVVQTRQVEDPNLHDPVSEQRMYRLTEQTGGAVYIPQSVVELDSVFTQISLDLAQQYLLSYYPQDDRKDKYFRFISLRVKTRPHLRVRARKGFFPETAQTSASTGDGRAQFSGSLSDSASAGNAAAARAPRPAETSAAHRRTAVEPAAPAASRAAVAPSRGRVGPDGPDTEEAAVTKSAVYEPVPTFTLTAAAPTAARKMSPAPAPATEPAGVAGETEMTPSASPARPSPAAPQPNADAGRAAAAEARSAEPAKAEEGGGKRALLSGGVLNGKALSLPVPAYPPAARTSRAHGKVVVEVTIDERGRVVEARAISGHPFLQQAAVQAARLARFTPALLSGEPATVKGTINYVFSLP